MLLKNLHKKNLNGKFLYKILGKCSQLFSAIELGKKCHTIIVDFFC